MLAESGSAACAPTDTQAAILLETTGHRVGWIEQFQGHRAFPIVSMAVSVRVNACRRIKQIRHLGNNGHGGDLVERLLPLRESVVIHHFWVDAVIDRIAAPACGKILRRHTRGWPILRLVD